MKVALNTKRAWTKKIECIKNVEGIKVVQMITLGVTSVPSGTINGGQHSKVKLYFECQKCLASWSMIIMCKCY